jgi:serine phosphatase RsbU (regulator of sigma subunit)
MIRVLNLFVLVFLMGLHAIAGPADSLENLITHTTGNNNRAVLLLRLAEVHSLKEPGAYRATNLRILSLGNDVKPEIRASANENLGDYYWTVIMLDSSRFYYNRALSEFLGNNNSNRAGIVLYKLAQVFNLSSNFKAALQYANESLEKLNDTGDQSNLANVYALLCDIQSKMGLKEKAINNCITSLKIYDEMGKMQGKARLLNSIGNIYLEIRQLDKSKQYFSEALEIAQSQNDRVVIARSLNNLADTHLENNELDSAFYYYDQALNIQKDDSDFREQAATDFRIGKAYIKANNKKEALHYLNETLKYAQQSPDLELRAKVFSELGNLYSNSGNLHVAISYLKRALADAQRIEADPILQSCYNNLAKYYDRLGEKENALVYFKLYMLHRESMFANQSALKIAEVEALYNLDKKEKEIELLKSENKVKDLEARSRKLINIVLITGLIFVIGFSVIIYRQYRIQNKANVVLSMQKEAIDRQKHEIELQRDNIKESNLVLEDKNRQITDSIEYAKRIQFSLLPDAGKLKKVFPSSFVIHLPRDIVSGDFYFLHENGKSKYIAVADCTGHGVPGAFMTVLAHSLLHQIMSNGRDLSTDEIFNELDHKINLNLNQHGISLSPMEGMDMGLFKIECEKNIVYYTGAKIPAYHYNQKEIIQVTPDRNSLGGVGNSGKKFSSKSVSYQPGDTLYLATDGYQDQFGGQNSRKFMKMHFRNLLNEVAGLPLATQQEKLVSIFNAWKGNNNQTDDILIMGIQL